jgi:DNA-directed RNA polymerase specialized sigma subunit
MNTIVTQFEPMVRAMATRYWQPIIGAEMEDLEQVARIGIVIACQTFDRKKGAFPTHASWCIKHELARYIESLENPVRLPGYLMQKMSRYRRVRTRMTQTLERDPTLAELAAALELPQKAISALAIYNAGARCIDEQHSSYSDPSHRARRWVQHGQRNHQLISPGGTPEDHVLAREARRKDTR